MTEASTHTAKIVIFSPRSQNRRQTSPTSTSSTTIDTQGNVIRCHIRHACQLGGVRRCIGINHGGQGSGRVPIEHRPKQITVQLRVRARVAQTSGFSAFADSLASLYREPTRKQTRATKDARANAKGKSHRGNMSVQAKAKIKRCRHNREPNAAGKIDRKDLQPCCNKTKSYLLVARLRQPCPWPPHLVHNMPPHRPPPQACPKETPSPTKNPPQQRQY